MPAGKGRGKMLPWSWQIASRFLKKELQEFRSCRMRYRSFGEEFYPGLGAADPMAIIAFSDN
jgi:hypothetical protein